MSEKLFVERRDASRSKHQRIRSRLQSHIAVVTRWFLTGHSASPFSSSFSVQGSVVMFIIRNGTKIDQNNMANTNKIDNYFSIIMMEISSYIDLKLTTVIFDGEYIGGPIHKFLLTSCIPHFTYNL